MTMLRPQERPPETLIPALEDEAWFAYEALAALARGDVPRMGLLAAHLRSLACKSKSVIGLLWRVGDMLGVSDVVEVQYPGCVDTGNPLTRGLVGCAIPVWLAGSGPPEIPHRPAYLRRLFEEGQALYIDGRGFSACEVITKVSSEIGTAHHSDRVVPWLATAMEYEAGQVPVLAVSMAQYGVLAVAYAEVLLGAAVGQIGYVRRRPVFPGAVDLAQLIPNGPAVPHYSVGGLRDPTREGSLLAVFYPSPEFRSNGRTVELVRSGNVAIALRATTDGVVLILHGLDGDEYLLHGVVNPMPTRLVVVVTWSPAEVLAYVNGEQIDVLTRRR